ncbi:hypothetical protein ONZ45_g13636 [Pleurotus djamor]|nr:hypothetical protein ONZ45_g13636 [Pleurotus djamor]
MSTTTTQDDPATLKFQQAIPYVLFSASPNIAALHAARQQKHHDHDPSSPFCPKCGSWYAYSDSQIRSMRKVKSKKKGIVKQSAFSRMLRHTCGVCGWTQDTLVERTRRTHEEVATHTRSGMADKTIAPIPTPSSPKPATVESPQAIASTSTSTPKPTDRPKARPKKKNLLEEMLAKNKKAEAARSQSKSSNTSGLAAFLETL